MSVLPQSITGNARVLATIGQAGELLRLFWPHIDYGQHVEDFRVQLILSDERGPLSLANRDWNHQRRYVEDSPTLETTSGHKRERLTLTTTCFVPNDWDAVVMRYTLTSDAARPRHAAFGLYERFRINESPYNNAAFYDEASGALVFYMRDTAIVTIANRQPDAVHCGVHGEPSSALVFAETQAHGGNVIQDKSPDAALIWDLGELKRGEQARLDIYLVFANSVREGIAKAKAIKNEDPDDLLFQTSEQWRRWVDQKEPGRARINSRRISTALMFRSSAFRRNPLSAPATEPPEGGTTKHQRSPQFFSTLAGPRSTKVLDQIRGVYKRSLLTMKLLSDRETGAIIAAPEFDREREFCGGYGYVWGRDGAFIAHAFAAAGHREEAEAFFAYAARVQEPEGVWFQRHYSTGELAPSWGLIQIDETGAILWGIEEHYQLTGDLVFLKRLWPSIERAAQYLIAFTDPTNGLPRPSVDLWEEYTGQSAYSSASVAGGLACAARCAAALGKKTRAREWASAASKMRTAIVDRFWDPKKKAFVRAINKTVTADTAPKWKKHDPANFTVMESTGGRTQLIQLSDSTIDSSLLGLSYPFGVLDCFDPKMLSAARSIRKALWWGKTGGLLRYEGDHYVGGNPWILTTLWLALYYAQCGDKKRGVKLVEWAANHATPLGLLSEQVDRRTGKPAWVVPLAWSHAMFVLAAIKLELV